MQKKSKTSKERDETYYILHNCGNFTYVIYYQNLRKEIDVRQKWLETVLTGEKKWILENQGLRVNFT